MLVLGLKNCLKIGTVDKAHKKHWHYCRKCYNVG